MECEHNFENTWFEEDRIMDRISSWTKIFVPKEGLKGKSGGRVVKRNGEGEILTIVKIEC